MNISMFKGMMNMQFTILETYQAICFFFKLIYFERDRDSASRDGEER